MKSSVFFNDENGDINDQLCRSIFRMMKITFYMTDDYILHAGDLSKYCYLILKGNVRVVDSSTSRVIAVLDKGEYFGDSNIIYNLQNSRTANVLANTITKVGVLDFS